MAKIISCLEHSVYQCLMRESTAAEAARCGCLGRVGVEFTVLAVVTWH